MSPIDRVVSRTQAFTTLGVSPTATRTDIRKAYRALAFEKHPDRNPADSDEFSKITEAYRYVCEHAEELGIIDAPEPAPEQKVTAPRRVSRPSLKATEEEFDAATQAECEAYLEEHGGTGAQHVPSAVYRMGRNLTYNVPTPLMKGRNEVALPTGMLSDTRKTLPKIVVCDFRDAQGCMFEMPADICAEHFPGARRIQIRFANT
ncbi:MAG: J domain-containing protein [Silicimonas sp.]|jgi:hypothetical protein|nr:J domain-containing protein [Silicimonas sp.]